MGTCSSSLNRNVDEVNGNLIGNNNNDGGVVASNIDIVDIDSDKRELEHKISEIISIDVSSWKNYILQFNEPISADQLQIWSRELELISTPNELTNIDNLLRIKKNIYSIDPSKYKNYLINFIRALLKKPNQNRVILVDLIYLLKICQDDLLSLYATLQIFYDIGFRTTFDYQQPCLIFNYKDVTHCRSILFWLQLHCKMNINYNDNNNKPDHDDDNGNIIECYKKYQNKLIVFIQNYTIKHYEQCISLDIIRLISMFVSIDFEMTDSWGNYIKSIFSFYNKYETENNNIKLNIFDMQRNESYDISINDIAKNNKSISNIHEMIVLKNQCLPSWVSWTYDGWNNFKNKDDLTSIYITYNDIDRATDFIIFDNETYNGYRFKKDKNSIMRSYKGIFHPIYHKLICLDGKYLNNGYLYDVDTNQYLQFNLGFNCNINNDFNACLCDSYSKLFYCESGKTLMVDINNLNDLTINNASIMKLNRSGHSLLYHDKLSKIIIGGGIDPDSNRNINNNNNNNHNNHHNNHNNNNDINISGRTIELYDIHKDYWSIIDIKTNYNHNNHPSLWYDLFNPFIINIENNDFYSSEWIDLREKTMQWHKNYQRKSFLNQFRNKNALIFS